MAKYHLKKGYEFISLLNPSCAATVANSLLTRFCWERKACVCTWHHARSRCLVEVTCEVLCPLQNQGLDCRLQSSAHSSKIIWNSAFHLEQLHLLFLKYSGSSNIVFKVDIRNGFHFPPCTYAKKITVIEILPLKMKPLELLSTCLSLSVFILAVKYEQSLK